MKIRQDFVTNSSSSSYIVALHKDFSEEELNNLIESNMDLIKKIFGALWSDYTRGNRRNQRQL